MTEPSKHAMKAAKRIQEHVAAVLDYGKSKARSNDPLVYARIIEAEVQAWIEFNCYNHRVVQQRLIDFIYRLGAMDPTVADEVRRQFKEWNLPTEAVNK